MLELTGCGTTPAETLRCTLSTVIFLGMSATLCLHIWEPGQSPVSGTHFFMVLQCAKFSVLLNKEQHNLKLPCLPHSPAVQSSISTVRKIKTLQISWRE